MVSQINTVSYIIAFSMLDAIKHKDHFKLLRLFCRHYRDTPNRYNCRAVQFIVF